MTNTKKYFKNYGVPVIGIIIFVLIWHIVSTYILSQDSTLPPPAKIGAALIEMWHSGELTEDILASLNRILFGFAIALFGALIFGITAARYGRLYDYVRVTMDLLSSIPPIAWTPVAILWFGIGNAPAFFIVFLGAFFPMFTGIYSGISRVDTELKNAARTLGATSSYVVRNVIFPAALPQILTGIKTGIGVAWFNVIAAELIGVRSGLGYKIQLNRTLLFSENVIGIMIVIGILGFLMTRFVGVIGNLSAPWAIQDDSRLNWIEWRRRLNRFFRKDKSLQSAVSEFSLNTKENLKSKTVKMKDSSKTIILEVNGITKSFDGELHNSKLEVMKELNFSVNHGEVFSILGPNGSGKTTIVNIIAGLLKQDAGYVEFDGHRVVGPSRERTVVFQNLALFPWRTCKGNILFALKASARERTENRDERKTPDDGVLEYLKIADLINFADAYPIDLSGGMKQRLALTRALAVSPKLILMDEPFASFDPLVRESSQETILNLLSHTSTTVLLVTHDLDEAIFMSDRILVLSERPARIKEIIHVPFERPRISKIRKDVRFHELRTYIWDLLRSSQEVKKTSTSS